MSQDNPDETLSPDAQRPGHTLGPIKLSPGITPFQVAVYLVTVVTGMSAMFLLGLLLPILLTNILHVPKGEQGRLAGSFVTVQQIAVLIFVSVSGGFADFIGRRRTLIFAFSGFTVLLLAFPFAQAVWVLFILYFLFGIASSANTGAGPALMVDYPANESRGKFIGVMLFLQGLSSIFLVGYVGARLPAWLEASGFAPELAGKIAYWGAALVGLVGLVSVGVFMRRDHAWARSRRRTSISPVRDFLNNLRQVLRHARENKRFGTVLLMGFAARSDSVIFLSFLSLWITRSAGDAGIDVAIALKTAGVMVIVFQSMLVITPPVFGLIADRLSRTALLIVTCGLAGLAFISTALIRDVFSIWAYLDVASVGITETALIVSIQSMMGQEAPPAHRGASMGVFAFLGSISVVIISFSGGYLFDSLGYVAPFVLVGLLNLLFAAIGFFLVRRSPDGNGASSPLVAD